MVNYLTEGSNKTTVPTDQQPGFIDGEEANHSRFDKFILIPCQIWCLEGEGGEMGSTQEIRRGGGVQNDGFSDQEHTKSFGRKV